ncbi:MULTISPECIES: acetyl-CoA carboxylase biotin carboxyl carrier protein [Streptococcus]
MAQFDQSSLREFSYKNQSDELTFSKNERTVESIVPSTEDSTVNTNLVSQVEVTQPTVPPIVEETISPEIPIAEGDVVESPLVGVAYLASGPDKPSFVSVGDQVKKGQTLMIIEAMKVMNEVPSPKDGIVTEILVQNEEMVEFGKGLVRIK